MLDSQDLFHDPLGTVQRVLDFVGLPPFAPDVAQALEQGQNKGKECGDQKGLYALNDKDRAALAEFYREPSKELEAFLGRELHWER